MKSRSWLRWLLLLPAALLLALSLGLTFLVLSFTPPLVAAAAWGVVLVLAVWLVLVRRGGAVQSSESGLMGRQSSKDGLL